MVSSFFSLKYGEFGPFFFPQKSLFGQVSAPLFFVVNWQNFITNKNIEPKWQSFMARYRKETVITPKRIQPNMTLIEILSANLLSTFYIYCYTLKRKYKEIPIFTLFFFPLPFLLVLVIFPSKIISFSKKQFYYIFQGNFTNKKWMTRLMTSWKISLPNFGSYFSLFASFCPFYFLNF